MGGANLALWLVLFHDTGVGGTDRALGFSHLLQVSDGLAERLDDARPRIWTWLALYLLLHCTRVRCTYLVNSDPNYQNLVNSDLFTARYFSMTRKL